MEKGTIKSDNPKLIAALNDYFPDFSPDKIRIDLAKIIGIHKIVDGANDARSIADIMKSYTILQNQLFLNTIPAIGIIPGIGSGILIKPTIFLTAGHCCKTVQIKIDNNNQVGLMFNYQTVEGQSLFTYDSVIYYTVKKVIETGDDIVDYGLLKVYPVKKNLKAKPTQQNPLKKHNSTLNPTDEIVVIGHPAGALKKGCIGEILEVHENNITYNADTLAGSSGSPIFLTADGKMVGIHVEEGAGNDQYNSGIKLSSIIAYQKKAKA